MNAKLKIGIAVLAGVALGVTGTVLVHAQQAAAPGKGYVVSEIEVTDAPTFAKYVAAVPPTLVPYGGQFLTRGNAKIVGLEGDPPKRFITIQFDTLAKATAWEESDAYKTVKAVRLSSENQATSRVFLVEGVPPQ